MKLFWILPALALAGCTAVDVRPVSAGTALPEVCIERNPQVIVPDFVDVLRDGFARHHVVTRVVEPGATAGCGAVLNYTALRSWDFKTYLSHAELRLWQDGRQIGYAEYHLRGKGGLSLAKWAGTREKIDPVIDQLLGAPAS